MADGGTVFIVCSGLGRIHRGFEAVAEETFTALASVSDFDLHLFKGAGESSERRVTLWNLPRDGRVAALLGKLTRRTSFFVEQASFFLSLLRHIREQRPDVLYFSEGVLGNFLWNWRRV